MKERPDPTMPMVLAASRTLVACLGGFAIARGSFGGDTAAQLGGAIVVLIVGAFAIHGSYQDAEQAPFDAHISAGEGDD